MRRFVILGAALVTFLVAGVALFAPQLPALVRSGFPPSVVNSDVPILPVAGAEAAWATQLTPLPGPAAALFTEAGGHALIAARGGMVLHEVYGVGYSPDTKFNSYSMVKSLVGLLVLRAVAEGWIASLDTPLPDLIGPDAPDVTLRAVLTMTSGLALVSEPPKDDVTKPLDDRDFSPFSPVGRLHVFGITAILDDLRIDPDRQGAFHYQSANTALLGLVVEAAFDAPLPDILSRVIWQPAGAAPALWQQNPRTGRATAYCCLYATARDWMAVGQHLLSNGTPTDPLLPKAMWRDWVAPNIAAERLRQGVYGQHLRHDILDRAGANLTGPFSYFMGHGGQVLYLMPEADLVVIRFGERPQLLHSTLYEIFSP